MRACSLLRDLESRTHVLIVSTRNDASKCCMSAHHPTLLLLLSPHSPAERRLIYDFDCQDHTHPNQRIKEFLQLDLLRRDYDIHNTSMSTNCVDTVAQSLLVHEILIGVRSFLSSFSQQTMENGTAWWLACLLGMGFFLLIFVCSAERLWALVVCLECVYEMGMGRGRLHVKSV